MLKIKVGPEVGGPHGPYRQSERLSQYRQHIQGLLQSGHAYRCFCTPARLDTLNRHRHDLGQNLGYDRKCASIQPEEAHARAEAGETHVVRFRAPDIWPAYKDLVYGSVGTNKVRKTSGESVVFEDAILVKSDGFPTYHWANICDDHDMKITHVIRGSEWMSSTPLHVAMYAAKGWTPPIFAHVPLLVDQNNQKLSKRNLDTDISSYKANGVFRESLTNFAALLGWSHQRKNDVMDLSELEEAFDLKITKGNTIVSFEKLQYLQSQHSKRRITAGGEPLEQMIRDVAIALLEKFGAAKVTHLVGKRQLRDVVASMLQAEGMPFKSPQQFADSCTVFVDNPRMPKPDLDDPKIANELATAASTLTLVPGEQWHHLTHSENLKQLDVAMGEETSHGERKRWKEQLYHYLRWALLGGAKGPSIPWTMEILGRSICVDRIQRAASDTRAWVQTQQNTASKPDITPTAFKAAAWHPVAA